MTVVPVTLEQTGAPAAVAPLEPDEPELDAPELPLIAMRPVDAVPDPDPVLATGPEALGVPEPAFFDAAEVFAAGCEDASTTVAATSTRTAARPTAVMPVHHILAARPVAAQRCVTRCLRPITPPRNPLRVKTRPEM